MAAAPRPSAQPTLPALPPPSPRRTPRRSSKTPLTRSRPRLDDRLKALCRLLEALLPGRRQKTDYRPRTPPSCGRAPSTKRPACSPPSSPIQPVRPGQRRRRHGSLSRRHRRRRQAGEIAVARPIGLVWMKNAVEAIRDAKFEAAMKDGQPVPVLLDLVVQFRIYSDRTKTAAAATPRPGDKPSNPHAQAPTASARRNNRLVSVRD